MKRKYRSAAGWLPTVLGLALFAVVAVWMVSGVREAAEVSDREGLRMAEQAVRQACVSCYALEGGIPRHVRRPQGAERHRHRRGQVRGVL